MGVQDQMNSLIGSVAAVSGIGKALDEKEKKEAEAGKQAAAAESRKKVDVAEERLAAARSGVEEADLIADIAEMEGNENKDLIMADRAMAMKANKLEARRQLLERLGEHRKALSALADETEEVR